VTLVVVGVALAGSIFYSLPSNVLSTRDGGDVRAFSARLMPQSWAFFTKPPSDPEFVAYTIDSSGRAEFASRLPNSRRENLFGLSRRQRAQGPEIANLANRVEAWTDCDSAAQGCRDASDLDDPAVPLVNASPVPTLCGRVMLVETRPVPWTFRDDYDGWRLDTRAALVDAECA